MHRTAVGDDRYSKIERNRHMSCLVKPQFSSGFNL